MISTIFFIWLGSVVPSRYLEKVEECKTHYGNCVLIGEKEENILMKKYNWNTTDLKIIHRSDVLKLLVLQEHGGIILDFDSKPRDWSFFKAIKCEDEPLFGEEQHWWRIDRQINISNWFICSGKNSSKMQHLIDNIDRSVLPEVLEYAGPRFFNKMQVKGIVLHPNVIHCYDSTWWEYKHMPDGCLTDYGMEFNWFLRYGREAVYIMEERATFIGLLLAALFLLLVVCWSIVCRLKCMLRKYEEQLKTSR